MSTTCWQSCGRLGIAPYRCQSQSLKEMLPLCRVLDVGRPEQVAALSRDAVEQDLAFLGLIVFRNELKSDSRDAILALKQGYVRPVMVTGDNAQASSSQPLCITC